MIRDALTVIDGTERSFSAIDVATDFARCHQAQLTLSVLFEQVPLIAAVDAMGYGMALNANAELQQDELSAIRERIAKSQVEVTLAAACLDPASYPETACREALTVDLALIGPESGWCDVKARRHIVEDLVIRAGTPTISFPEGWEACRLSHAVLGWNGSPEASRAARALVAVLEPGATIDVLVVDEEASAEPAAADPYHAIATHLGHHGFAVEVHRRSTNGLLPERVMEQFTRARHAQLLAIGAYSHSRLREGLLGGVTRALIDSARTAVLFAG